MTEKFPMRNWPYHVAVPARLYQGTDFLALMKFCEGLNICDICYTVKRDGIEYAVYIFADRSEAEKFRQQFNGEIIQSQE